MSVKTCGRNERNNNFPHQSNNQKYIIMKSKVVTTMIGAVALTGTAITASAEGAGDFCNSLQNIGKLYKDKSNPYIQEVSVFGRFHAQYAYVDGEDVNGNDFNRDFEEVRRMRAGMQIKAFNGFAVKANINLEDDDKPTGGDRVFGYQNFDQVKFSYKMKNVLGFDELKLTYGRHKIKMGHESHLSSKKIKTVERSAISNKIFDGRFTGLTLAAERGGVEGTLGILSLDDSDFIGNWDAGKALYLSTGFEALQGQMVLDLFYTLDQGDDDNQVGVGYEWAASASWEGNVGSWDLMVNTAFGDNGDQSKEKREGMFYGLVVMPSKFIVEDKVEFVARYQYQGSTEDEGIRMNSRYVRRSEIGSTDVGKGRGNSHQSLYAGLNYYFCGHNSKIMTGVEYEALNAEDGDVTATTLWMAYRMYF